MKIIVALRVYNSGQIVRTKILREIFLAEFGIIEIKRRLNKINGEVCICQ